jgi:hypothetical protein
MSVDNKYHGYSNRETWLVYIWISNDEDTYSHWKSRALNILKSFDCDRKLELTRELEVSCKDQQPHLESGLYSDLLTTTLSHIVWPEIAHWLLVETEAEICHPMFPVEYSRSEAIANRVLFDVTETAKEAGFKIPVAFTNAAWFESVAIWPEIECQDEAGRLWDVLTVLFFSIKRTSKDRSSSTVRFTVSVRTDKHTSRDIELKSICGPGDNSEPVLTIMLSDEV